MAKHTGELRRAQGCGDWLSCGEVCGEVQEVQEVQEIELQELVVERCAIVERRG